MSRAQTSPAGARPDGRPGAGTLVAIALAAVIVLVGALLLTRYLVGGGGAPAVPSGLSVSDQDGRIRAVWNQVDGADSYLLLRDEGAVVYSGPDSAAVDDTVTRGEHRYSVIAVAHGVPSAASEISTVTVGDTWGSWAPLVAELPDLLPQFPDQTGWRELTCMPMARASVPEVGDGPYGTDRPINRARLACESDRVGALHVTWQASEQGTEAYLADLASLPTASPVTWRHGTGYYFSDTTELVLRPSTPSTVVFSLSADKASKDDLLGTANDLPLG